MPGQRAKGTDLRNISMTDALWDKVKAKAAREGISASEAIRRLAESWVAEPD